MNNMITVLVDRWEQVSQDDYAKDTIAKVFSEDTPLRDVIAWARNPYERPRVADYPFMPTVTIPVQKLDKTEPE